MAEHQRVFPTLRIGDLERAEAFYVERLGFRVDWRWQPSELLPAFLQISRDGMALYLSQHPGDCEPGGLAHLYVADVDGWYAELLERGVEPEDAPVDQPWGNREFRVRDPDGNRLCICKVLGRSHEGRKQ